MIADYPQHQPSKKVRQGLALPVYTLGVILNYLAAARRRLAELAICLALVASLVLVMLIGLVVRIRDRSPPTRTYLCINSKRKAAVRIGSYWFRDGYEHHHESRS